MEREWYGCISDDEKMTKMSARITKRAKITSEDTGNQELRK